MLPSEIILSNCKTYGWDQDKVIHGLLDWAKSKKVGFIQHGDTVIVLKNIGDQNCEFHIYSTDSPFKFITSLKKLILDIQQTGLKRFYGKPNTDTIMRALELVKNQTGIQINLSDKPNYSFLVTFK